MSCNKSTTSIERYDWFTSISVINSNSDTEAPFERDKLFLSIYGSLKHRNSALRDATAICETVISKLSFNEAKLKRDEIVSKTHSVLKSFDSAAAIHYKSFHRQDKTK